MIPTFNIVSFADAQLLYVIFNGVAMICQQTSFIWSVASLAGVMQIILMTTKATVNSVGQAGGALIKGWLNVLAAFVFAILLTQPSLKGTVTTENLLTGQQTSIANVPVVISVVPFVASSMADTMGNLVENAFQGTNAQASYLASRGNGFMNPLKTLLSARHAVDKLPGITSQINSVVEQCLDSAAGVDYASVSSLVMNAGNTNSSGASALQSLQVSNLSASPTSIGALLYQASLNGTAYVTDIPSGSNAGADALSCSNAAMQVATNINAALSSSAFGVAVTGAVSSTDTANGQTYSLSSLDNIYLGIRQSSSVLNSAVGGVDQANSEVLNLLFESVVRDNLDCLKADGAGKAQCLATMELRKATEQANIDNTSAGQLAMQFAGQFGNYMLALIIGLSPIMIIFMMFRGVDSGKSITVAVHMIVWPYLVTNVGGSLINGMIYYNVGNFIVSMGQGGMINQASAAEVYRSFSMQIGAASALMAALPVLMTTIFAMSESAAVVSLASKMGGSDHFDEKVLAPDLVAPSAMARSGELMNASMQLGGGSVSKMSGAFDGVSSSQTFGTGAKEVSSSTSKAITDSEQFSSGAREVQDWTEAFKSGNYSKLGVSNEVGREVRSSYESNLALNKSSNQKLTRGTGSDDSTSESIGGSAALSMTGLSLSLNGGIEGQHRDRDSLDSQAAKSQAVIQADSLSDATSEVSRKVSSEGRGEEISHTLARSAGVTKEYAKSAAHSESLTQSSQEALRSGSAYVAESNKIGSQELAFHSTNNRRYTQFLDGSTSDSEFSDRGKFQAYKASSIQDMKDDVITVASNPYSRNAIVNHRAMVRMAQDEDLGAQDRLIAQSYLAQEGLALSGLMIPKTIEGGDRQEMGRGRVGGMGMGNDRGRGIDQGERSSSSPLLNAGAVDQQGLIRRSTNAGQLGAGLTGLLNDKKSIPSNKKADQLKNDFKRNIESQKDNLDGWVEKQIKK